MRRRVRGIEVVAGLLVLAAAVSAPSARAQAPAQGNENVAAEALFEEGRNLVAAGKYAEACPKFADSQRLGPSVGTLLNLANCYEKLGRTATAWATYRAAASAANAAGRKDYLATAQRRADGLAPKLARLTVSVTQPVPGLQLKRDGVVVDPAEYGIAIPVDTGSHAIEASAPGHKPWSQTVDVAQDGAQATATVPALEEAPADAIAAQPAAAPAPASPVTAAPSAPEQARGGGASTQRVIGLVVGGVGIAAVAVGGVVAIRAKGIYNDSLGNCDSADHNSCNSAGVAQRNDARSAGNAASVLMGAGAAAVVAGVVVFLTAPAAHPKPPAAFEVLPTLGGLLARGTF